jgi:hypothetical protein
MQYNSFSRDDGRGCRLQKSVCVKYGTWGIHLPPTVPIEGGSANIDFLKHRLQSRKPGPGIEKGYSTGRIIQDTGIQFGAPAPTFLILKPRL